MQRLRIISLVLALLMTIQMLPIASIGTMLSQNQWTEELPHNSSDAGKTDTNVASMPFLPPFTNNYISVFAECMAMAYIHTSERIPSNHSTDVVSPPPDVV